MLFARLVHRRPGQPPRLRYAVSVALAVAPGVASGLTVERNAWLAVIVGIVGFAMIVQYAADALLHLSYRRSPEARRAAEDAEEDARRRAALLGVALRHAAEHGEHAGLVLGPDGEPTGETVGYRNPAELAEWMADPAPLPVPPPFADRSGDWIAGAAHARLPARSEPPEPVEVALGPIVKATRVQTPMTWGELEARFPLPEGLDYVCAPWIQPLIRRRRDGAVFSFILEGDILAADLRVSPGETVTLEVLEGEGGPLPEAWRAA